MSRATTQDQLTTRSRKLFVTPIMQSDGAIKSTMSTQSLNAESVRVNHAWDGEVWDGHTVDDPNHASLIVDSKKKYVRQRCSNSGALFLLTTLLQNKIFDDQPGVSCEVITKKYCDVQMNFNVWKNILCFIFGSQNHEEVENVGYYTLALLRPISLFKNAIPRPYIITDAAMRGEEDIVLNILDADPSLLLKTAIVKNSVDVAHEVTPLQAAVMVNDVQLIERMKEHFERLTTDLNGDPIDGLAEMQRQMIEIYKKSLRRYFDLTEEKFEKLNAEVETIKIEIATLTKTISTLDTDKNQGKAIDWAALKSARETLENKKALLATATNALSDTKKHSAQYLETLQSDITDPNYLEKLVQTHDQAQINNKFYFEPYVKTICDIDPNGPELQDVLALIDAKTDADAETQTAIAKGVSPIEIGFTDKDGKVYSRAEVQALPFNQLTLIQKLNRFREKLTEHMQHEIIFNPNHILRGLEQNDRVWDGANAGRVRDPNNYAKRAVIFSQLVGWAQRKAAEPVKQDMRQGTLHLTEGNESRTRQSRFNIWNRTTSSDDRNSFADVSISSPGLIDGVGYKFAGGVLTVARWCPRAVRPAAAGLVHADPFFSKLMSNKNSKLSEFIMRLARVCTRRSEKVVAR